MGRAIVYCGTCGKSLREDESDRSRAAGDGPGCAECRPEPARPGTKSRTSPVIRSSRSKGIEDPLAGILLNVVLVAVGALVLVFVTPGETTAEQRGRLEAALTNIRKIRDSDPTFTRASEVISLYDAAANVAGFKRPEVDRLREEYRREFLKSLRE